MITPNAAPPNTLKKEPKMPLADKAGERKQKGQKNGQHLFSEKII